MYRDFFRKIKKKDLVFVLINFMTLLRSKKIDYCQNKKNVISISEKIQKKYTVLKKEAFLRKMFVRIKDDRDSVTRSKSEN